MFSNIVLSCSKSFEYPKDKYFRPSISYPEYPFKSHIASEPNDVYDAVREGFVMLGLDNENFGKTHWNPLRDLIVPGDKVLIKPNMVMDENKSGGGVECLYTQPSVVAAVIDYVIIALKGKGTIIVGDAPMQECNFDKLLEESGYLSLLSFYKNILPKTIEIEIKDFRGLKSVRKNGINVSEVNNTPGKLIDLEEYSAFHNTKKEYLDNLRITNYDPALLKMHHNQNKHEYLVSEDVIDCDVFINMPKPKTHRKGGVTISLKNIVGTCVRKEYLPHHSCGAKSDGGDEYLNHNLLRQIANQFLDYRNYYMQTKKCYSIAIFFKYLSSLFYYMSKSFTKEKFSEGSWYGNDTIARTIVDLNKILFYTNKKGTLQEKPHRKYFIVADMIISGEKEGPVLPSPKKVGIIAMGSDPVCFDETILELMGAKKEFIKTIKYAREFIDNYPLTKRDTIPYILSNNKSWDKKQVNEIMPEDLLYFIPTSGWVNAFRKQHKS